MFNIFNYIMGFSKNSDQNARSLNMLTAQDYYDRMKMIVMSLYEWENLPESCNARFLEKTLFDYGYALFVNDPNLGFLTMKCTPSGSLNYYDEPVSFTPYGVGYASQEPIPRDQCVFIRNNYLEKPSSLTVQLFASRLTEAERTVDVNIKAQKTPVLIRCGEKERLTLKNIYNQYEGNEPLILEGKALETGALTVLKTDAPFVADKVTEYKRGIWNEFLSTFGINNNPNEDKRERLSTVEVNTNNIEVDIMAQTMLLVRQEACDMMNKLYKTQLEKPISVKMRSFSEKEFSIQGEGETE